MFRKKNTNGSHVENDIFPKVRKYLFNIDSMINILHKKDQTINFTSDFTQKVKKLLTLKQKKQIDF